MNSQQDKRLIEDYLPIVDISIEASGEPRTKGHISTLHVWRARRPLVACRAAVYGALVPQSQFVPDGGGDWQKLEKISGRGQCEEVHHGTVPISRPVSTILEAQMHILNAHAERLSEETGSAVTVQDILDGRQPRPRVLDMFAGGGAIPLEAARLGCESYSLDLNPVAFVIELCTVTFPQKYGADLADDVESWAARVLEETKRQVSDVFQVIKRGRQDGDYAGITARA